MEPAWIKNRCLIVNATVNALLLYVSFQELEQYKRNAAKTWKEMEFDS